MRELSGASLWLSYAAALVTAYCFYEQIYFWIFRYILKILQYARLLSPMVYICGC